MNHRDAEDTEGGIKAKLNRQGAKVAKEGNWEPQMNADERRLTQKQNCYSCGHLCSSTSLIVALVVLTVVTGVVAFELLQITAAFSRALLFGVRSGGGNAQASVFHIPSWLPASLWFVGGALLIYKEWRLNKTWLKVAINAVATLCILILFFVLLIIGIFS